MFTPGSTEGVRHVLLSYWNFCLNNLKLGWRGCTNLNISRLCFDVTIRTAARSRSQPLKQFVLPPSPIYPIWSRHLRCSRYRESASVWLWALSQVPDESWFSSSCVAQSGEPSPVSRPPPHASVCVIWRCSGVAGVQVAFIWHAVAATTQLDLAVCVVLCTSGRNQPTQSLAVAM